MGEAKRRGTYEQRVKEGIEKRKAEFEAQRAAYIAREDAMSPQERKARLRAMHYLALCAGIIGGIPDGR